MTARRLRTHAGSSSSFRRMHPIEAALNALGGQPLPARTSMKIIIGATVTFLLSTAVATMATAANPPWVHVNASKKQVTFDISEGPNGQAGQYNFDGYAHGHMTMTVPTGWHVTMKVTNDGTTGHSMEIIKAPKTPPVESVKPAFKHAETKDITSGMPPGASSTFSFKANKPGQYWLMCAVPGHALLGMWDHFVVSSKAKRPSVTERS
ncbi:MAG: sulfocyanin-like copper-binding protein [Gammaproteobacteria bacterium]|jgi:sulfocyanin